MSDQRDTSWDEIVDRLRGAANELRSAAGREGTASAEEEAAAARLKEDVARLERSAADLRQRLAGGFEAQRAEFENVVDRDRAEQSAGQLKAALNDLIEQTKVVAGELKSVAQAGFAQAQPELKTAIRTLEDVAGSAGAWIRTVVDPDQADRTRTSSDAKPPADNA